MTKNWKDCKNLLIIRADNMGDVIMSVPAIRALKESFSPKITILTSSMAMGIIPFIAEIDETIAYDLPWIKTKETINGDSISNLVSQLKEKKFDGVVIFTVFSQNPLPAAMIAYMANIPLRLGYCRENPYNLLTDWVPDKEPYSFIQHQVERDLALVHSIGATTSNRHLHLTVSNDTLDSIKEKLVFENFDYEKPWIIFHAGVSEKKREYPPEKWVAAAKKIIDEKNFQVLFTGSKAEKKLCDELASLTGKNAFSVAGIFTLKEFIALLKNAPVIVSVNTGTIHIAAAVNTPVVVLYAQTNPQHTPWMVPHKILPFGVDEPDRSKNEVIRYLYKTVYKEPVTMPDASEILNAVNELLG